MKRTFCFIVGLVRALLDRSRTHNPCCKRSSLNVGFVPKATELLRRREMTQQATKRHACLRLIYWNLGDQGELQQVFRWTVERL